MSKPLSEQVAELEAKVERQKKQIVWLDIERERLAADNAELRKGSDALWEVAKHVTIPSEHIRIKGAPDIRWKPDTTPRLITADELRAGQAVARKSLNHYHWRSGTVFWNVGINGWSMNAPHFDGTDEVDIGISPETIVLLEDTPVNNVDTTPATWKENGENFTRPLTVHALNVAPVGSVVQNAGGIGWTKVELGMWAGALGLQTWSGTELLAIADSDATLTYPEDQS